MSTHVVLFAAPPVKRSPTDLRAAFDSVPAFRDSLPDVVSPPAALGIAVKAATTDTQRWVHAGQKEGNSRWILTSADVDRSHARIEGYDGVECRSDGTLHADPSIAPSVRLAVEGAYLAARGVVEPSRLNAALALWCKARGQYLRDGGYLVPTLDADTTAVLAAVVALGGIGAAFPVGGAQLQAFAAPVARSLEETIADVLASTSALIAKAKLSQAPDGPAFQTRSGDTAHRDIDDVRARLTLWRDRLGLALTDVDAQISAAESLLDVELDAAAAAATARKAKRAETQAAKAAADRAAKKAADEQAEMEERRAQHDPTPWAVAP